MQKLILDYSTWRCGGDFTTPEMSKNKVGEGNTQLNNEQGYLCCLGQFSLQLNPELKPQQLKGHGEPCELGVEIPLLTYTGEDEDGDGLFYNQDLSDKAIETNDDPNTTPEEKIVLLRELFAKENIEIEVINKP